MKKYLIGGALALCAGLFVTSCTHDDDLYSNIDSVAQKTENFEKAFTQAYGTIASNKDWGFEYSDAPIVETSPSRSFTRTSYPNGNDWTKEGYTTPDPITDEERENVKRVFAEEGAEEYESLVEWDCFFVQHVFSSHKTYRAHNGGEVDGSAHMDWLCAYDPEGHFEVVYLPENNYQPSTIMVYDDHIYNFNASDGSVQLMTSSSTSRFGFKNSEDSKIHYTFRMAEIDGNYYVGFDFVGTGSNPNQQIDRDLVYNDWIVKIVKAEKVDPGYDVTYRRKADVLVEEGRILCEDVGSDYFQSYKTGGKDMRDFDYNDVVFNAQIYTRTIYEYKKHFNSSGVEQYREPSDPADDEVINSRNFYQIQLYAAGGTLPLTIDGEEVHEKFNVGSTTMVNTVDQNTLTWLKKNEIDGMQGSYVVRDPIPFENSDFDNQNSGFFNTNKEFFYNDEQKEFYDSENDKYFFYNENINKILDIPVKVLYSDGNVLTLKTEIGKAPHKILVEKSTQWPSERCDIGAAYPTWENYVADGTINSFTGSSEASYLYDKVQTLSTEDKGTVNVSDWGATSGKEVKLFESPGYDISSPLYFYDMNIVNNLKAGDIIRVYGSTTATDWNFSISNGGLHRVRSATSATDTWNGYAEITLNATDIAKLKDSTVSEKKIAMVLSGSGIIATKVTIVMK